MLKALKNKYFWLALGAIAILFVSMNLSSDSRDHITSVEKAVREIFTPLQSAMGNFRHNLGGLAPILASKQEQARIVQNLKKENDRLAYENQRLKEYEQEVTRLRQILSFKAVSDEQFTLVPARLIARNANNWYNYIIIDRGAKDGIEKDMVVINPYGLVGRVDTVSKNSSLVCLITDREIAVGAILQESRETRGIVEGLGDSNELKMNNIPYYSKIAKGNRVLTSGLSSVYPKGIDIGTITKVEREPNGLLMTATINPAVDFDRLEEVLVITNYQPVEEITPPAEEQ